MLLHLASLLFIFGCTSIAWMILGATITSRTQHSGERLGNQVVSTWGGPQEQRAPSLVWTETVRRSFVENNVTRVTADAIHHPLPLESTAIRVDLGLEHRQKGLLWYSTYQSGFDGTFQFRNNSGAAQTAMLTFPYPAANAVYDDVQLLVNGAAVIPQDQPGGFGAQVPLAVGQTVSVQVKYKTQGLDTWRYRFGENVARVRDFSLKMTTNFKAIDFPENTLSPTAKRETAQGWELDWTYRNLVSGFPVAMQMPEKLQPGPLAGQIAFFAPVSLFFFFFVIFLLATLRNINLHPVNYFFLAAAFFAFHLLMAYLVDHVSIHAAFLASAVVSLFLVISYLRIVVGPRFAWREAAGAQFVYLVLFSYAFFFKGYTGLTVTIGAIITLYVAMQATARVRWDQQFRRATPAEA